LSSSARRKIERELSYTCQSFEQHTAGLKVAVISFPRQEWHKLLRAAGYSAFGPLQSNALSERHSVTHWIFSSRELCR